MAKLWWLRKWEPGARWDRVFVCGSLTCKTRLALDGWERDFQVSSKNPHYAEYLCRYCKRKGGDK